MKKFVEECRAVMTAENVIPFALIWGLVVCVTVYYYRTAQAHREAAQAAQVAQAAAAPVVRLPFKAVIDP